MARRIVKHSTRLSQEHEGALDTPFHQGQRVQTIDGLPGRILFVSASFAPGVTEYEVHLDNGMGQGTYTASQLRPVPDDYRGGHQPIDAANLPAGVRPMAAYMTEDQARERWRQSPEAQAGMTAEEFLRAQAAETHLASDDYPEMGEVLHERPDPGALIKVIGARARRLAADGYGGQEDPRDEDYNGGEGDTGMYWAQPAQQNWMHENIGPQEEAPPPMEMMPEADTSFMAHLAQETTWLAPADLPGPLARLAQIEEAGTLWGGTFHCATTINGTQIDNAGDAPEHGTIPRASEPNDYDGRSHEGEGDDKWNEPVSGDADKHTLNGATIGMYPEGISAGGGPGIEVGAFTASRVPWTGPERTHLHNWDQGVPDQGGDFVPSTSFTGKMPIAQEVEVPAPDVIEAELRAQAGHHTAASEGDWAEHLRRRHGYDEAGIDRILGRGDRVSDIHQGIHDAGMARHDHELDPLGEDSFLPRRPDPGGRAASDPEAVIRGTTPVKPVDPATWDPMTRRRKLSSRTAGVRVKYHGPDDFSLHDDPGDHDSPDNDLDVPLDDSVGEEADTEQDKNSLDYGDPQVSPPEQRDKTSDMAPGSPAGGDQAPGLDTEPGAAQQELPPTAWPMTQAPVQQGGPAYTQGTHDQHGRVFPPPPPAPAPTGADGEPLGEEGEGGEPGEEGDGKKVQLEIKTGASEETLETQFGRGVHLQDIRKNRSARPESGGAAPDDPEHAVTDSEPIHAREDDELDWAQKARRYSSKEALAAFVASAESPAFRFEFTAAWSDVVAKAKRIRKSGRVRITHSSAGMVIGEVGGDHDVYESGIQRVAGRPQTIQHWACGCPWGSFRQDKSLPGRLNGRPCSHVMALQFEALARTRRERKVDQDLSAAELGVPHQVVVKSAPPWGAGGWAQTWLAPAASLHREGGLPGVSCYYQHPGECPGTGRVAESIRHSRPRDLRTEITPNPLHDPESMAPVLSASHVMSGYIGGRLAGWLHFSSSDDGVAHQVHMLHSYVPHQGVASAMMDDLYSHVKSRGGWLDHGKRTTEGNNWWAGYREPHPEINTHHTQPQEGWQKYWSPLRVSEDAEDNLRTSGGRGAHTPIRYNPRRLVHDDRHEEWTNARGFTPPAQQATAALLAAGEELGEIVALGQLAGFTVQADQTNAPWGSENVTAHPPQKPYGATEPPNPDQSPASYGFLSAPDPDNWGSIQENNALQMPLSNQGSRTALSDPGHKVLVPGAPSPVPGGLNYPSIADQEDQSTFGYTDRANTAGPSTAMDPRDPGGIRMEEALDPAAEYRHHLTEYHGVPPEHLMEHDYGQHARQHGDLDWMRENGEPLPEGTVDHPPHQLPWEDRHDRGFDPGTTGHDQDFLQQHGIEAELHDGPEPALDPDGLTAEDFQDRGERARQAAGIDGTAGDAQDIPHGFDNDLADGCGGCRLCGLSPDAAVHHTAAADGTIGGGDAGSGLDSQEPADVAALGEFGAVRQAIQRRADAMGDQSIAEGLTGGAQLPSPVTQEPGMGSGDEYLTPGDQSIQTIGQQWSGDGADSDEEAVEPGQPQGSMDDIVASFQHSAAARQYGEGGPLARGPGLGDGDIAQAAKAFLKTADVLPDHEAAELISEGRGERARNLGLLRLEGTHYEDEDDDLKRRGLSLHDFEDDVISA
jgi:hypothetical protein